MATIDRYYAMQRIAEALEEKMLDSRTEPFSEVVRLEKPAGYLGMYRDFDGLMYVLATHRASTVPIAKGPIVGISRPDGTFDAYDPSFVVAEDAAGGEPWASIAMDVWRETVEAWNADPEVSRKVEIR